MWSLQAVPLGFQRSPDAIRTGSSWNPRREAILKFRKEEKMGDVVYVSKSHIERRQGPFRIARLPGESQAVIFSVHGAIAEHYRIDPATLKESHSSTIDYVICATAG